MSRLILHYLPVRARAETPRMILRHGGVQFEDVVVPFSEWPVMKPSLPFKQLPTLTLPSGTVIAQSGAICRYAAKLVGLYPDEPEAAAVADQAFEMAQQLSTINPILNAFPLDGIQPAKHAEFFDAFPGHLECIEKLLGDELFFSGAAPMYGDFHMLHVLDNVRTVEPESLAAAPGLTKWMARMEEVPSIKTYFAERPSIASGSLGRPGTLIHKLATQ